MTNKQPQTGTPRQGRAAWEPPRIERVGNVGSLFQGAGGKLSITAPDTGDMRKPAGQG
jgi:hypothetical protein